MAITNAQQFKQLVNPPMKGKKRPGYRGDDAYGGGDQVAGGGDQGNVGGNRDAREIGARMSRTQAMARANQRALAALGDPDPEVDIATKDRQDTITSFTKNLNAARKANPLLTGLSLFNPMFAVPTLLKTAFQTGKARSMLGLPNQGPPSDNTGEGGGGPVPYWAQLGFSSEAEYLASLRAQAPSITEQETEDNEIKNYRLMSKGGRAAFGGGSDMGTVADSKGNVGPGAGGYQGGGTGPVGRPGGPPTDVGGGIKSKFDIFNPIDSLKAKLTSFAGLTPEDIAIAKSTEDDDEDEKSLQETLAGGITNMDKVMDRQDEIEARAKELGFATGGRIGLMGGGMPYEGGIMDLESARQMYGLGKLVKKVTRTVKKIAKSPIGKAALAFGAYKLGNIGFGKSGLSAFERFGNLGPVQKALFGIGATSAIAGLMTPEEEEEQKLYAGADIDDPRYIMNNPGLFTNRRLAAEGGDIKKEPVAKKVMPLLDMDGQEMDLRAEGGFVPIGRMEKADDVPARLSKNEFVFTADAVRNAGDGSVDKGAEVMYNMMKNLESGGDVSEESQGLEGARKMFQTSQRLEEVL